MELGELEEEVRRIHDSFISEMYGDFGLEKIPAQCETLKAIQAEENHGMFCPIGKSFLIVIGCRDMENSTDLSAAQILCMHETGHYLTYILDYSIYKKLQNSYGGEILTDYSVISYLDKIKRLDEYLRYVVNFKNTSTQELYRSVKSGAMEAFHRDKTLLRKAFVEKDVSGVMASFDSLETVRA